MTGAIPTSAMVLAAGLGLRLRPLTENCPKPLIELAGRTLLDRALDHLFDAGVARVVVNLHYLGHMIESHLSGRSAPAVEFSREDELLLETGGGVKVSWERLNGYTEQIEVRIDDEGPGLPDRRNLFVPFFTTRREGSGVGLALSRQIMIAHGGTISFTNNEQGGARFSLAF